MPKAFWLFSTNAGDGSSNNPNRPYLPAGVGGRMTNPGDIFRLTGPTGPNAHRHLLLGGIALTDHNLDGQAGGGHTHFILRVGGTWRQATVGVASHTHTLNIGANNSLSPDFFLFFWAGSNAEAQAIVNDPKCVPVVEADMVQDESGAWSIGELDETPWTAGEQTQWRTKMLDVLGLRLPNEADRGKRLVLLFLGTLFARHPTDERVYRLSSG